MAGEEKSKDSAKEGLPHLSLMEKAWDAQWVMRFVCIVLFIDGALVLKGGSGLLQWSTSTDKLWQDLGFLVVAAGKLRTARQLRVADAGHFLVLDRLPQPPTRSPRP